MYRKLSFISSLPNYSPLYSGTSISWSVKGQAKYVRYNDVRYIIWRFLSIYFTITGVNKIVPVVYELLVRSLLIGRRKQWHVILSIVSVLFGVTVRHHWWLLFLGSVRYNGDFVKKKFVKLRFNCTCKQQQQQNSSGYKPHQDLSPPLAGIEMNSIFYDVLRFKKAS